MHRFSAVVLRIWVRWCSLGMNGLRSLIEFVGLVFLWVL